MNNNMLLSAAVSVIPILALVFVCAVLLQKLYFRIRARFGVAVNCWFCNQNTKVPYASANSWTCPHCEQYNGFTKDGDYNRLIFQQFDTSNLSNERGADADDVEENCLPPKNGFCNVCNEAQRLKVEKLAQFEPKNEAYFDAELKMYKSQLEEQYRLCGTCDRHLRKVLREKKKMVLGSKFLDFIIKGAETLQQSHFNQLRDIQHRLWKGRLSKLIGLLTLLNVCCLLSTLPDLQRIHCTRYLGESVGQLVFVAFSHVLALGRVLYTYIETLSEHDFMHKCALFVRTTFMMLLYSMGLKLPQLVRVNFASLYLFSCPFGILAAAFVYNIMDGFRLTHYTLLLVLWSTLATGFIGEHMWLSQNTLLLLASLVTIGLLLLRKQKDSRDLHDTTTSSFHKIYSEDYMSDEDTISLISQQLNISAASVCSMNASRRSYNGKVAAMSPTQRSPLTASVMSLNIQSPPSQKKQFSPNTSFQSYRSDNNNTTLRSNYAASMCNFPTVGRATMSPHVTTSMFASSLELSCRARPMAPCFGMSGDNFAPATPAYASPNVIMQPHINHNSDEHLPCAPNNRPHSRAVVSTPMHSPFSASASAVFQQPLHCDLHRGTPTSNLLSPSRFSTNSLTSGSWLSGGYFNGNAQAQRCNFEAQQQRQNNAQHMTAIDENLSRASSQSSGFESQTERLFNGGSLGGGLNRSRENSYGVTETLETNMQEINPSAFRRVGQSKRSFSTFDGWNAPPARKALHSADSFNLRRINDELPCIRRGDLLKKWKEGQMQTAAIVS